MLRPADTATARASREGLSVGIAGVLCLAFFDLAAGLLTGDGGAIEDPASGLLAVAAAALLFSSAFVVMWLAGRLVKLDPVPLAASLVVSLLIFFVLDLTLEPYYSSPELMARLEAGLVAAAMLAAAAGLYLWLRLSGRRRLTAGAAVVAVTAPVVLAETALVIWLLQARPPGLPVLAIWGAYAMALPATVAGLARLRPGLSLPGALLAMTVLSPVPGTLFSTPESPIAGVGDDAVRRIILLTVDTLRADALSAYGGQRVSTPHLDRLAEDGILFRQAVSPSPWTVPAMASIMTGLLPSVHRVLKTTSRLPAELETLAEHLRAAGYITAAIGGSDMLAIDRAFSQGFDHYDFVPDPEPGISFGERLVHRLTKARRGWHDWTSTLPELATEWLTKHRDRDFFLWLHYFDPHLEYSPPPRFLPAAQPPERIGSRFNDLQGIRQGQLVPTLAEREWIRGLYEGEVRHVDESIGRLLESLERLDLYDGTLIVLTSDHGEEMWEHGGFEHGHTMYQEVLRVPLLIKLPRGLASSVREVDRAVSTAAILPTVLELCGIGYRAERLSATSIAPLFGNSPVPAPEPVVSSGVLYSEDRVSIIFDQTKYIRSLETGEEELYDLAVDPQEQVSIAASAPGLLERGRRLLAENEATSRGLRTRHRIPTDGEETELSPEELRRLRALGYVG